MTPEQIDALRFLLSIVQPPVVAQLATQGSRDTWVQIHNVVCVLEPLINGLAVDQLEDT